MKIDRFKQSVRNLTRTFDPRGKFSPIRPEEDTVGKRNPDGTMGRTPIERERGNEIREDRSHETVRRLLNPTKWKTKEENLYQADREIQTRRSRTRLIPPATKPEIKTLPPGKPSPGIFKDKNGKSYWRKPEEA